VLHSLKQFADQLFSGAPGPGKQRALGILKGLEECIEDEKPAVLCRWVARADLKEKGLTSSRACQASASSQAQHQPWTVPSAD